MKINNARLFQHNSMMDVKDKLGNAQNGSVSLSKNQNTVTFNSSREEKVTYDLKEIIKSSNKPPIIESNDYKSHLGANYSWRNEQVASSYINMSAPAHEITYEYGHFDTTEKTAEFFGVIKRLSEPQQEKIKYITPTQDWLDLAGKLDDKQLNQLVDVVYDMSESIFLNGGSSNKVEKIVNDFNQLNDTKLSGALDVMSQLREKAIEHQQYTDSNNSNKINRSYSSIVESGLISSANPLGFKVVGADVLLDYSKLIFSDSALKDEKLAVINNILPDVSYLAARGLIDAAELLASESKNNLFNLLSSNDNNETDKIFSYIGSLTTKSSFITYYQVDFDNNERDYTKVYNHSLSDAEQADLIESMLSIESDTNIDTVLDFVAKAKFSVDDIQAVFWQQAEKYINSSETRDGIRDKHINAILTNVNFKFHQQQSNMFNQYQSTSLNPSGRKMAKLSQLNIDNMKL